MDDGSLKYNSHFIFLKQSPVNCFRVHKINAPELSPQRTTAHLQRVIDSISTALCNSRCASIRVNIITCWIIRANKFHCKKIIVSTYRADEGSAFGEKTN